MMRTTLYELIEKSACAAFVQQKPDGSMPPGCNGPYHDPETPVRNTAHWLFLFASLYMKTGDAKWKTAGEWAVEYLLSSEARPYGKTFHCRNKAGKDKCNGLIGQAWVIEALVQAAAAFDRQVAYSLAEDVFLLHPWDSNVGIWKRVEVDGTELPYDVTFNHQLWFAAAGGMLAKTPEAQIRAENFLEKVAAKVQLYPNGVIFHASAMGSLTDHLKTGLKLFLRELKSRSNNHAMKTQLYSKSAGYHGFNLYAFAMLKKVFPDAPVWKTDKFKNLVAAHRNGQFIHDVKNSVFGYRYNLSGIEIAFAVETFFQNKQEAANWLNRQFEETWLDEARPLSKGVPDPDTAMARIYQAARLSEEYEVTIG